MRLRKQTPQTRLRRTAKRAGRAAGSIPRATRGLVLAGVGVVATAVALGNRRSRQAAKGAAAKATAPVRHAGRDYDDTTLARKVESEIFRSDEVPKGAISVNAQHGTVELRGQVEREEEIAAIGSAAAKVAGVEDVHNLLHTPGSEPGHSPVSDPAEVRERAEQD